MALRRGAGERQSRECGCPRSLIISGERSTVSVEMSTASGDQWEEIELVGGVMLKPFQIRGARAFLGWPAPRLASEAGVSESTVRDYETGRRAIRSDNLAAIEAALERAGIEFIADGIRMRGMNGHAVQFAQTDLHRGDD